LDTSSPTQHDIINQLKISKALLGFEDEFEGVKNSEFEVKVSRKYIYSD